MRHALNLVMVMLALGGFAGLAETASAQSLCYHIQRAVFRCPKMNRGLAVDGQYFWVGEFGGWLRCYDRNGRRLPDRDLGGGTVQYLGHGASSSKEFVATAARDFVAVLPIDGGPMRRIDHPIKGFAGAVASTGTTLWVMNGQSPVVFEMDLEGKLLRKFTAAQGENASSRAIALD